MSRKYLADDPAFVARVEALWSKGLCDHAAAAVLGCHYNTVKRVRQSLGLKGRTSYGGTRAGARRRVANFRAWVVARGWPGSMRVREAQLLEVAVALGGWLAKSDLLVQLGLKSFARAKGGTYVSRLVAGGWLERRSEGRRRYYRATGKARAVVVARGGAGEAL